MATYWIIDAYNFIRSSRRFAEWEAKEAEQGKEAALKWLGKFSQLTGEQLWVVFDAYSRIAKERAETARHGLKILESRGAYTADEEIVDLARQYGEAAIVVSSDRAVLREAVRAKASILTSEEFEREVAKIFQSYGQERDQGAEESIGRKTSNFQAPKEKKRAYQRLRRYQG